MATRLHEEFDQGILTLTLTGDNELNILDRATLESIRARLAHWAPEAAVRAVVLTGCGDRAFSVGANLRELAELTQTTALAYSQLGQGVTEALADFPAPVIAAINGLAFGGGLELAVACDVRLASPTAAFAYPASKLGILPGFGGTQRAPGIIGLARAKELMFFGRTVDARTAERWGLVNAVAEDLRAEARRWALELVGRDAFALRQTKETIGITERADFFYEQEAFALCFAQPGVRDKLRNWASREEEPDGAR